MNPFKTKTSYSDTVHKALIKKRWKEEEEKVMAELKGEGAC